MVLGSKYRLRAALNWTQNRGNKHMKPKSQVKLLGLIIDDRLLWNSYIDQG